MKRSQNTSENIRYAAYGLTGVLFITLIALLVASVFAGKHRDDREAQGTGTDYARSTLSVWSTEGLPAPEAFLTENAENMVCGVNYLFLPENTPGTQQVALLLRLEDGTTRTENATLTITEPCMTWELGTEATAADLLGEDYANAAFTPQLSEITKAGTYTVNVQTEESIIPFTLYAQDTTPPTVTLVESPAFYVLTEVSAEDFVASCEDASDVTFTLSAQPDTSVNGTFPITLTATDACGNVSTYETEYTVSGDGEAPVISGVSNMQTLAGIPVYYLRGVTAEDAFDGAVEVTASEPDGFSIRTAGDYTITFTASDESGNIATETAKLTVLPSDQDADALTEEDVYRMGDAVMHPYVADETLTEKQLARKAYIAVQERMFYKDNKDIKDWHIAAAIALYRGYGDCRNYYALSKLFFDCAGFESLMVEHTPSSQYAAKHFWIMVKIDGEWWHCDTTPRVGISDFFMWTDAQMDRYSARNGNCFARDKSLYPATPE